MALVRIVVETEKLQKLKKLAESKSMTLDELFEDMVDNTISDYLAQKLGYDFDNDPSVQEMFQEFLSSVYEGKRIIREKEKRRIRPKGLSHMIIIANVDRGLLRRAKEAASFAGVSRSEAITFMMRSYVEIYEQYKKEYDALDDDIDWLMEIYAPPRDRVLKIIGGRQKRIN